MTKASLSCGEARRLSLAAQGFDRPRPPRGVTDAHVAGVIRQLGLLQIDFVNVLVPSHYLVLFSRLGPYDRRLLDGLVYRRGEFTEQWAHEASIVPVDAWPLLEYRRATHRVRPYGFEAFLRKNADYAARLLTEVRGRGPLGADDLPESGRASRLPASVWHRSVPRAVLEAHFGRGQLAVAARRPNFSRSFDLAERVIPRKHFGRRVGAEEARRELLLRAARAHGVGTARDLADYYRMAIGDARPRLAELVEAGSLRAVRVEGWREPAYLDARARIPAKVSASSLLSPFDPVVWFRPRTARLFDFEYRLEIFVPSEKRRWGYYVLPFLMDDRLVARVDLKAERSLRRLRVAASYLESSAKVEAVAPALAEELRVLAAWLGLEAVSVERRGDFARRLAAELASPARRRPAVRRATRKPTSGRAARPRR